MPCHAEEIHWTPSKPSPACPAAPCPAARRSGADKVSIGSDAVEAVEEYIAGGRAKTGQTAIEQISRVYGAQVGQGTVANLEAMQLTKAQFQHVVFALKGAPFKRTGCSACILRLLAPCPGRAGGREGGRVASGGEPGRLVGLVRLFSCPSSQFCLLPFPAPLRRRW